MREMTHRFTPELSRLANEHYDSCAACSYHFKAGDTTHLGYQVGNVPEYVCDKCSASLIETAERQYYSPRPYSVPDPNTKLWRYMDFTKYVSLLSTRSLYFARADSFDDTYEGAKGLRKAKVKWDAYYSEFFREVITKSPPGYDFALTAEEVEKQVTNLLAALESTGKAGRTATYINCWHESEHESEAMWRLYSNFLPNAVVVRTTFDRLYKSLGRAPSINIGRVKYIDLQTEYAGPNDAFWRKRKSFEHEREVRALTFDFTSRDLGKPVPCDIPLLIEAVYVSPKAPAWFINLINDVNVRYGLGVTVSTSELIEEPFF
jgi:hypothetical protein